MDIPQISNSLSSSPRLFPHCCLAVSDTLITHLAALLPQKPAFTVSVGSGSGLLEALISHRHPHVSIEGVEVSSAVNRYIAEEDMTVVNGTWGLHSRVAHAAAWMFVYPREPKLVTKYIDTYSGDAVELILWLGPRADWADYEPCFADSSLWDVGLSEDGGTAPYEMLAVMRKRK